MAIEGGSQAGMRPVNLQMAQDEPDSLAWKPQCRSNAQRMRHLLSGVTARERPGFFLALKSFPLERPVLTLCL